MKNKKAFTLIELLVVIAIIGIIATLAVLALQQARSSARDSKRVADIKQIHTALELFYNDHSRYPTQAEWDSWEIQSSSGEKFIHIKPSAPVPVAKNCDLVNNQYIYTPSLDGRSYVVSFCIGREISGFSAGQLCATPGGIIPCDDSTFLCGISTATDSDGNVYQTIQIGSQCWLNKNLKTTSYNDDPASDKYEDGDIFYPTNNSDWIAAGQHQIGAYAVYPHDSVSDCDNSTCVLNYYGALYNWYAVNSLNGICPLGWKTPTDSDWDSLLSFAVENLGYKLKSSSLNNPSWDGDNEYGFLALPAGVRSDDAIFSNFSENTYFWTASSDGVSNAWARSLFSDNSDIVRSSSHKAFGLSVRCLKK